MQDFIQGGDELNFCLQFSCSSTVVSQRKQQQKGSRAEEAAIAIATVMSSLRRPLREGSDAHFPRNFDHGRSQHNFHVLMRNYNPSSAMASIGVQLKVSLFVSLLFPYSCHRASEGRSAVW